MKQHRLQSTAQVKALYTKLRLQTVTANGSNGIVADDKGVPPQGVDSQTGKSMDL